MTKKKYNTAFAKQGQNALIHSSYEEDNDLLPSPEILEKYKTLDPQIIEWIKNRCDKEQDARIFRSKEDIENIKKINKNIFTTNVISLCLSVVVIIFVMFFSYTLIIKGYVLQSTIFAGGTIIFYAIKILNFNKSTKKE